MITKGLREHALKMARRTVERLEAGIAQLHVASVAVTAKSIEAQTGLTFQTIRRNQEAYALYRDRAAAFRRPPPAARAGRRGKARRTTSSPSTPDTRDPLYASPKAQTRPAHSCCRRPCERTGRSHAPTGSSAAAGTRRAHGTQGRVRRREPAPAPLHC